MRRFELVEGTSKKFWEVSQEGKSVTVRFGRIGSNGQTQTKDFASETVAKRELEKLVGEKTKKGYGEVVQEDTASEAKAETASEGDANAAATSDAEVPAAPKKPAKKAAKPAVPAATAEPGWVDAGNNYSLTLRDGKLVCRKGTQTLASVPSAVKDGEVAEQLTMLKGWLAEHDLRAVETVEGWMLRSLPVPGAVLAQVWPDPSWRRALENAVVVPLGPNDAPHTDATGLFRGVSSRGIGVVNLDGETVWIDAAKVLLPHPILIEGLDDLRSLLLELSVSQGIKQLLRETFAKPRGLDLAKTSLDTYASAQFDQLNHVLGQCRKLGVRLKGGSATVRVWERGRVFEGRYWVGSDAPDAPAWTGDLGWVDEREQSVRLVDVPPVAFSEGMRMAAAIYAARKVDKENSNG